MSQRQESIRFQVDKMRAETAKKNRNALKPIAETDCLVGGSLFQGRNNIPFRGSKDATKYHAPVGKQSDGSVGNFILRT